MGALQPWHWIIVIEVKELQADGKADTVTPAQPATQGTSERVEAPVNPPGHNPTDVRPA